MKVYEDAIFNLEALLNVKTAVSLDFAGYWYRESETSAWKRRTAEDIVQLIRALEVWYKKAEASLRQTKAEELAKELEMPIDKISEAMKLAGRTVSVDAPFAEGEENSLLDVLPNNDSPMADSNLNQESLAKEVERVLEQLNPRDREILKMFFGIGCQEMTLEEIGAKFDLTRERVRQIKEKAIRQLKGRRSQLLMAYLG